MGRGQLPALPLTKLTAACTVMVEVTLLSFKFSDLFCCVLIILNVKQDSIVHIPPHRTDL